MRATAFYRYVLGTRTRFHQLPSCSLEMSSNARSVPVGIPHTALVSRSMRNTKSIAVSTRSGLRRNPATARPRLTSDPEGVARKRALRRQSSYLINAEAATAMLHEAVRQGDQANAEAAGVALSRSIAVARTRWFM